MDGSGIHVVLTTVGTPEQAERIARALVQRRLAACVNVVPTVRSFYTWKGEIQDETEVLLLVKTAADLDAVQRAILELHPYDLPEILAVRAGFVEERFARWVREGSGTTA
jgi:periplasmic divalent cation tolerance protein